MSNKNYKKIKECRLCGSKKLSIVLPLNKSPLCDAYLKNKRKQQFYDLKLCLCDSCKFVQIDTVVDPKIIYRDYIYVTTSTTLISHFKLNKKFKYLVDENPGKINTFSPGFHIPVYSSKRLKIDKPSIIVILAWRYKKQIIHKLKKMNLEASVVTPIPKLEVIKLKK